MDIKPIETVYNGYRFRSRLEARWAVFFDTLGVKYEYEPEGFRLPSGACYLPDFKVTCYGKRGWTSRSDISLCGHCAHCIQSPWEGGVGLFASWFDEFCEYCDPKSDWEESPRWLTIRSKGTEIIECLKYESKCKPFDLYIEVKGNMTAEDAKRIKEFAACGNPVLVVGKIPPIGGATDSSKTCSYEKMNGVDIYPFNYALIDGDYFAAYPAANDDGKFYLMGDDSHYIDPHDEKKVEHAYGIARQARFEHGEHPA